MNPVQLNLILDQFDFFLQVCLTLFTTLHKNGLVKKLFFLNSSAIGILFLYFSYS